MTSRIEPHRVSAYNTSKHSENKMHDDTVAKRYGFIGGLVPGVDVMAYMMHLPVAKWGRAFLERGLIEARFVKPVYDGELTDVTGEESNGVLAIQVESRGELCATGTASLPAAAPSFSLVRLRRCRGGGRAQAGGCHFLCTRQMARRGAARLGGGCGQGISGGYPRDRDDLRREGLGHPGLLPRVMNKVLVDNAIMGPWIHVGTRMQLLSAARIGDEITARAKVIGNYDKKGHRFVELDALVVANGKTPLAHCHHIAIYQPREQAAA